MQLNYSVVNALSVYDVVSPISCHFTLKNCLTVTSFSIRSLSATPHIMKLLQRSGLYF